MSGTSEPGAGAWLPPSTAACPTDDPELLLTAFWSSAAAELVRRIMADTPPPVDELCALTDVFVKLVQVWPHLPGGEIEDGRGNVRHVAHLPRGFDEVLRRKYGVLATGVDVSVQSRRTGR